MVIDFQHAGATAGGTTVPAGAEEDPSIVETRFHFDSYDEVCGTTEARDGEGKRKYLADYRQQMATIPCFTAESQIACDHGMVSVGALTPGMRVLTRDNGFQALRWIGRRRFGWQALGLLPLLRPVCIAAGALGDGLPEHDMVVSPNHRFLTRLPGAGETGECLTTAHTLVGLPGIRFSSALSVEYVQLLFDRHELLLADGCWSESFQPTWSSLTALGQEGRADLTAAVPGIEGDLATGFETVRPPAKVSFVA